MLQLHPLDLLRTRCGRINLMLYIVCCELVVDFFCNVSTTNRREIDRMEFVHLSGKMLRKKILKLCPERPLSSEVILASPLRRP